MFQTWFFTKVLCFLTAEEDCTIESSNKNKAIVKDAFGVRYEVTIKQLGAAYRQEGDSFERSIVMDSAQFTIKN